MYVSQLKADLTNIGFGFYESQKLEFGDIKMQRDLWKWTFIFQ